MADMTDMFIGIQWDAEKYPLSNKEAVDRARRILLMQAGAETGEFYSIDVVRPGNIVGQMVIDESMYWDYVDSRGWSFTDDVVTVEAHIRGG